MEPSEPENNSSAAILDALPLGVLVLRPVREAGEVVDFEWKIMNRLASAFVAQGETLVGKRLLEMAPELKGGELVATFRKALETGSLQKLEHFLPADVSRSGQNRWYAVKAQPLHEDLLVTFEDISDRKLIEDHIKRLAFQDVLTGLYNRRYFLARVPELLALAQREAWNCALIYFDLNGFKTINDTHGHNIGDKVLQAVAWRLSKIVREGDIFFRSGGDEFAFFLPNSGDAPALVAAKRVAVALKEPFEVQGHSHEVGASIGVAVMLSEEASVDSLLERADTAMYSSKRRKQEDAYAVTLWTPGLA